MKSILLSFLCIVLTCTLLTAQHTVILKTGERMSGKVQSLSNGIIVFDFKGNSMKLKVDEVSSIVFSEGKEPAKTPESGSSKLPSDPGEKSITANNTNVKYKVADRTVIKAPVVNNLTQEKGTVVVTVTIDKYGHVRKAVPGAAGSTTKSDYLWTKAKQAAESALFDNVPNAPLEQTGYMIIVF
jgi:hypothetical protein